MLIKFSIVFASLGGGLAVLMGAFGAHVLRGKIEGSLLETFQTAVAYQMYHCLALLAVVVLMLETGRRLSLEIAAFAFMLGVSLFSGSLYALVFTNLKWFGPITPIGGLSLMFGWLALVFYGFQRLDG